MNDRSDAHDPAVLKSEGLGDPMSDMDQRLGSRYVLKERLGRGAMGTVWRAQNTDTGQFVAVKVLSEELSDEPDMVTRFIQERNTLRAVSHPNLVRIHDLIVEDGRLAIVMDLVNGPDLHRHLVERGVLSLSEAAVIGRGVASALATIHAAGIIHRDLKPANILLDLGGPQPQPKLVDFGIARMIAGSRLTARSSVVGTPQYLSPEAISGTEPSPALDIYAFGIALYELLTAKPPFYGEQLLQVLNQHMYQEPPWPPSIPPEILPLLQAMLAKDPRSRPTADQLVQALDVIVANAPAAPFQAAAAGSWQAGPAAPQSPPLATPRSPLPPQASPLGGPVAGGPLSPLPRQQSSFPQPQPGYQTPPGQPYGAPGSPLPGGFGTPAQSPIPAPSPSGFFYPSAEMFEPNSPGAAFTPNPPPFTDQMLVLKKPKRNKRRLAIIGAVVLVLAVVGTVLGLSLGGGGGKTPVAQGTSTPTAAASKSTVPLAALSAHHWTLCCDQLQDALGGTSTTSSGVVLNSTKDGNAYFNGKAGTQIIVGDTVINTEQSFTIAFYLNMYGATTTGGGRETVVEQRGTKGCAACVEYDPTAQRFVFEMQSADTASATTTEVRALAVAKQQTWYRIIASYNAQTQTMSLYIGGVLQGTASFDAAWSPTGPLSFGSGLINADTTNWYSGNMADMWIWNRSMTPAQVNTAAQ